MAKQKTRAVWASSFFKKIINDEVSHLVRSFKPLKQTKNNSNKNGHVV